MAQLDIGPYEAQKSRIFFSGANAVEIPASFASPLATESQARKFPGVVIHPDFMGLRPLFEDLSWRLATHGFSVICPDPFVHLSKEDQANLDPATRMRSMAALDDELQMHDLIAAANELTKLAGISTMNITGFCLGGMQVLKAAATGRFDRAVSFYGQLRLPPEWQGGTMGSPLGNLGQVCPTLAIFGALDPFSPAADIADLRKEWRDRPDCEILIYPKANHAFVHDPDRPSHRQSDAMDAWVHTLDWFNS